MTYKYLFHILEFFISRTNPWNKQFKNQFLKCTVNGKLNKRKCSKQVLYSWNFFIFQIFGVSWTNVLDLRKKEFLVTNFFIFPIFLYISWTNLEHSVKNIYAFFSSWERFDTFHEHYFKDFLCLSVNIQLKFFI